MRNFQDENNYFTKSKSIANEDIDKSSFEYFDKQDLSDTSIPSVKKTHMKNPQSLHESNLMSQQTPGQK